MFVVLLLRRMSGVATGMSNDELDDMTNSWRFPHKLITNDGFSICQH